MKRIFLAALVACASAATAAPADTETRRHQFERGLVPAVLIAGESPAMKPWAARMAELEVPGMSVAVIHEGRIDWARGYGAKRPGGEPVTETTLFQAASISKPVFAFGVLHLVDEGRLKLDANVNDYLKSWTVPDNGFTATQKVTLRRLLSHTAGLTVHGFPGYAAGEQVPTVVQILDGAPPANTAPIRVDVEPGSLVRYSGGGYTVAQLVLADVTGKPTPEFMRDAVLTPLGMDTSTFEQPLPAARAREVALPFRGDGMPVSGGPHTYPEMAAAGLWTTPSDLARYALGVRDALAGKSKVISAATARAMLTPAMGNQGIGPQVGGSSPRKFFTHNGGNEGYRCALVAYEDGEGAVVMTNADNGGSLMYEVMRTLAHVYGWPDFGPALRTVAAVKPATLDRLLGVYELDDKALYVLRREDGGLVGNIIDHLPMTMLPSSDLELFARDSEEVVTFTADDAGAVTGVKHVLYGQVRTGKRVDDARSRKVLGAVARDAERIRQQRQDPRTEPALRKLLSGISSGKPDLDSMSPPLAELTQRELPGLTGFFGNFGELKSLAFQRVTETGADEYLAEFAKGKLRVDLGVDADGRIDRVHIEPR